MRLLKKHSTVSVDQLLDIGCFPESPARFLVFEVETITVVSAGTIRRNSGHLINVVGRRRVGLIRVVLGRQVVLGRSKGGPAKDPQQEKEKERLYNIHLCVEVGWACPSVADAGAGEIVGGDAGAGAVVSDGVGAGVFADVSAGIVAGVGAGAGAGVGVFAEAGAGGGACVSAEAGAGVDASAGDCAGAGESLERLGGGELPGES